MSNTEAGVTEKGTTLQVYATSDRRDFAVRSEDESVGDMPDGGYGWVIVVAILFLNAVTWGKIVSPASLTFTDRH